MSGFNAEDARTGDSKASEAISERQCPLAQAGPPEGVGGSVVGKRKQTIQNAGSLFGADERPGRDDDGPDPATTQRGGRPSASAHFHVQAVRRGCIPSRLSPEMEGVHQEYVRAGHHAVPDPGIWQPCWTEFPGIRYKDSWTRKPLSCP